MRPVKPRRSWRSIATAPKDGTAIEIRGYRFLTGQRYRATAVWATRRCPAPATGWFPATDKHDDAGPYLDVNDWRPVEHIGDCA